MSDAVGSRPGDREIIQRLFSEGPLLAIKFDSASLSELVVAGLVGEISEWVYLLPVGVQNAIKAGYGKAKPGSERRSQPEERQVPADLPRGERVVAYRAHVAPLPERGFDWIVSFARDVAKPSGEVVEQVGRIVWFERPNFLSFDLREIGLYREDELTRLLADLYAEATAKGINIGSAAPTIAALQAHARDLAEIAKALAGRVPSIGADRR